MADRRHRHLNCIGVIGLIVCACFAGYVAQPPAAPKSRASVTIDGGHLEPAEVVDASPPGAKQTLAIDHEPPFGMETEPVGGGLAAKWSAVEFEIAREGKVLADCRAQKPCPEPAQDLLKIVAAGSDRTGRARVGLINRAVDLAITPTSDEVQWGVEDHWSSPFETLRTRRGDCEDYAIVKYAALLEAGLSNEDVKIVIVRDLSSNADHAVAAARVTGEWLILDNRWLALARDTDVMKAIPKFLLDEDGARLFVPPSPNLPSPYASRSLSAVHLLRPA